MTLDLDLKAAREAVARRMEANAETYAPGSGHRAHLLEAAQKCRTGGFDRSEEVVSALAAIRIRQEMEAANV